MTEKDIKPTTTVKTYWRAVLFIIIPIVVIGLLIAFPQLFSTGERGEVIDTTTSKTQSEPSSAGDNSPGSAGYR